MRDEGPTTMPEKHPGIRSLVEPPLSRREYFAAMAMQGIMANIQDYANGKFSMSGDSVIPSVEQLSVAAADGLIEALNRTERK